MRVIMNLRKDKMKSYISKKLVQKVIYDDGIIDRYGYISSRNDRFIFVKFTEQIHKLGWNGATAAACVPSNLKILSTCGILLDKDFKCKCDIDDICPLGKVSPNNCSLREMTLRDMNILRTEV